MPWLLREVNRNRWIDKRFEDFPERNDLPASNLNDMRTGGDSSLSLWVVNDNQKDENIKRIGAAVALAKKYPGRFDYLLIEPDVIQDAGFEPAERDGTTKVQVVNGWHRDILDLTARNILELALLFAQNVHEVDRIERHRIVALSQELVDNGEVPYDDLNDYWKENIRNPDAGED